MRFLVSLAIFLGLIAAAAAQQPMNPAQINFGSQVQISTTGTGEYGGRLTAADGKYNLRMATFVVRQDGAVSTPVTLQAGHALRVTAALTINAPITLGGNSVVECSGHGSLAIFGGGGFVAGAGAANVTLRNCPITGNGTVLSLSGGNHYKVYGLTANGVDLVSVATGGLDDLAVENNQATGCPGQCIFVSGNVTHTNVHGNHLNGVHGVEFFGIDAKTNPTLAQIMAGGPSQFSVTGNTCVNVGGSCVWGSGWHDGVVANNVADGCGDTCFDSEGAAHVDFIGNHAHGAANFDYSTFAVSYFVRFLGNHAHESTAEMFRIKYTGGIGAYGASDTLVDGNFFVCDNPTTVCQAAVLEGNIRTTWTHNHFFNATFFDIGNASVNLTWSYNEMKFTLPTTLALQVPTSLGGNITTIEENIIISYVPQAANVVPIQVDSANYNQIEQYYLFGNKLIGGWQQGISLLNNGGNVPALFWLRDNVLPGNQPATTPMVTTGGNSGAQVFKNGNNCNIVNACY